MRFLRKILLASLASLSLLLPMTQTAVLQAGPTHSHHRVYYVYYRASPRHAWAYYGGYYNASHAAQAANYFRYYGYDAFYR